MKTAIVALAIVLVASCGNSGELPVGDQPFGQTSQAVATSGASYTFPVGSLIIPMDTTYQDNGMFLAYGLVYELLRNDVPINWVIKQNKRLSTIAPTGATRVGTTATFTTTAAHNLAIGDRVTVRDVGIATYNGTWTVASIVSQTAFTVTLAATPAGSSGGGTVTPADFIASATDKQGGPAITNYGYRGGPFVIDQPDVAAATPIINAWQTANPTTKVHTTTTAFTGFVKRRLVAAPTIAQFDDGNADIATAYLNAAKIPDSQGLAWTAASVDLLTPAEVAGASCTTLSLTIAASPNGATSAGTTATFTTTAAHNFSPGFIVTVAGVGVAGYNGTWKVATVLNATRFTATILSAGLAASGGGTAVMNNCQGTRHDDGALFDSSGSPAYCQMMSMHWGVANAATQTGREVVREYRRFLQFPTHLFAECQAVNAIENNTNPTVALAATPNGATAAGNVATFTTIGAHNFAVGDTVLVAGVGVAGYNGTWIITAVPALNQFRATIGTAGLAASGGGTAATYNGLFLTRSGYSIGNKPAAVDSYNYDQPYAQYDGKFTTTGGSEPSYTIPPGGGYKAQDVVMLTAQGTPEGVEDVWMTGFLDGQCNTTQEFCDPSFAQGKVSYLGGHDYGTALPASGGASQGARLFLNALFEAPCATDLGVAQLNLNKSAPASTNGNTATYSITAFNTGTSVAGNATITDPLPVNVAFVPPASRRVINTIARAGNVVTLTTAANHTFVVGDRVIVTGVTNATFDGTFVITQVPNATQIVYAQTAGNATSSGGSVTRGIDGACIGTAAQCGGSGGGIVKFELGAVGPGQSITVTMNVQFSTPAIYTNTASASFKAGATTFSTTSNTTSTCYYAGNPAICGGGGDPNAPSCANGTDDDGDGLIDFPDDPGCDSLTDTSEVDASPQSAVKGRVLIVFDTSGSMMWNTCGQTFTGGDGSLSCPGNDVACATCGTSGCGNTIADDSRIQKVKTGITNVVAGFGEVEWGLMRFKQLPVAFSCGTVNVNKNDGGWQGAGASPCTGFNAGDLLVKFDPESANDLLVWMDGSTNYPGTAPLGKDFELRASGNTPLAGSLASARSYIAATRSTDNPLVASCRPYRVILVTDGAETCAGDPSMQASLLFGTGDPDGRVPVHVIGFSTPDAQTQNQLNQIASFGGTGTFVAADNEAQLSAAIEQIVQSTILVELCNDLDDDCDSEIDEDFPDKGAVCNNGAKGACFRAGVRVCTADHFATECNAPAVTCTDLGSCTELCNNADDDCDGMIDEGIPGCNCQPLPEICNGLDDNCDGLTDNGSMPGVGDACGLGIGACTLGTTACVGGDIVCNAPLPTTEICNSIDDDCDTFIDEGAAICYPSMDGGCTQDMNGNWSCKGVCHTGLQVCNGNMLGPCTGATVGTAELCNGLDDDCDGTVDEDWPNLGMSCSNGQQGVCALSGTLVCDPANLSTPGHYACTAPPITPGIEICNGDDDDCDGIVDNNLPTPPFGEACGNTTCSGILTCVNGQADCTGMMCNTPNCMEVCNGADDDCDTTIDEGVAGSCTDCCVADCCVFDNNGNCVEDCTIYQDVGECDFGDLVCTGGGFECVDYVGPKPEICNGKDDDCDGIIDDGAACANGTICLGGGCVFPCEMSEFPCPLGYVCKDIPNCGLTSCLFCTDDPCNGVNCAPNEQCDHDDGTCHDICEGVMCTTGTSCVGGICQSCFTLGCPSNEVCVLDANNVPGCQPDPCAGVMCSTDQFCNAGTCTPLTCEPACPGGQSCFNGTCVPDKCYGIVCPTGKMCRPADGACIDDPCGTRSCGQGQTCDPNDGSCVADPCTAVDCPDGTTCKLTVAGVTCLGDTQPASWVTVGGGGCSSTQSTNGWWLLVVVPLARRRRSR